jgi:hypothetical protein
VTSDAATTLHRLEAIAQHRLVLDQFDPAPLPPWLAHLILALAHHVPGDSRLFPCLHALAPRLTLTVPWDQARASFTTTAVQLALAAAQAAQPDPPPGYWLSVRAACAATAKPATRQAAKLARTAALALPTKSAAQRAAWAAMFAAQAAGRALAGDAPATADRAAGAIFLSNATRSKAPAYERLAWALTDAIAEITRDPTSIP